MTNNLSVMSSAYGDRICFETILLSNNRRHTGTEFGWYSQLSTRNLFMWKAFQKQHLKMRPTLNLACVVFKRFFYSFFFSITFATARFSAAAVIFSLWSGRAGFNLRIGQSNSVFSRIRQLPDVSAYNAPMMCCEMMHLLMQLVHFSVLISCCFQP